MKPFIWMTSAAMLALSLPAFAQAPAGADSSDPTDRAEALVSPYRLLAPGRAQVAYDLGRSRTWTETQVSNGLTSFSGWSIPRLRLGVTRRVELSLTEVSVAFAEDDSGRLRGVASAGAGYGFCATASGPLWGITPAVGVALQGELGGWLLDAGLGVSTSYSSPGGWGGGNLVVRGRFGRPLGSRVFAGLGLSTGLYSNVDSPLDLSFSGVRLGGGPLLRFQVGRTFAVSALADWRLAPDHVRELRVGFQLDWTMRWWTLVQAGAPSLP